MTRTHPLPGQRPRPGAPPRSHPRRLGRARRRLDLRLRLADLAPGVRGRRGATGEGARLASRAGDALARQPRHAGVPGPGVRADPGRLVPRPRLPDRAGARRGRAAAPLGPRDAERRLRPEVARLPDAAGRRARPRLHAQQAQPEPHRRACPTASWSRSCARPTAATAARSPIWSRRRARCAPAASATATSSGWSPSRAATRSPPERPR